MILFQLMLWQCHLESHAEFSASDVSSEKNLQVYPDLDDKENQKMEIKKNSAGVVVDARTSDMYKHSDAVEV